MLRQSNYFARLVAIANLSYLADTATVDTSSVSLNDVECRDNDFYSVCFTDSGDYLPIGLGGSTYAIAAIFIQNYSDSVSLQANMA